MNLPDYRRFGDYTLLGEIAAGGMGVVQQAVHTRLNRPCALKLIRTGAFASAAERARFLVEAEAAAALDHPDIVRVRQAGEAEGQLFLEMELVEGGTPAYLAPELAAGRARAATTAADVYGLGAILYEALTGRPPCVGETPLAVLHAVQAGPPPPSRHRPGVPRDLEILVLRAMHREPAGRFPAAGELADELERWLRGEPIRSRAAP